jgi:hypothetical protein
MIDKYEVALTEIKNNFSLQCEGVDVSKDSARSSLNASGLIIALISVFEENQRGFISLGCESIAFWLWIITYLLFIFMIFAYVIAINPISMSAPIKSTKEKFDEIFFDRSDKKAVKKLITRYQDTIEGNRKKLNKVVLWARITNWSSAFSILFAMIAYILSGMNK